MHLSRSSRISGVHQIQSGDSGESFRCVQQKWPICCHLCFPVDLFNTPKKCLELMKNNNPLVIPRNHKIEEALEAAEKDNLEPMNKILEVLDKPYVKQKKLLDYQLPSKSGKKYQTFCGT